ncbi:YcaO-like family protein [Natronosporangium hydrolyticum]|uniref:YcaO-like family protein n=1 Tax=Natronosporangium hydrolyticum TaxID=2811111 RepID=A0A895YND4_9ACTN|nr:YcaO-like family protein [Natronosporangium hydrolyticum]QSB16813.1 YcaO-like family protein [Natronosporangium hydrolyticum]
MPAPTDQPFRGPRLAYAEVRRFGPDQSLVVAPDGTMFEVAAPVAVLGGLLDRCDGATSLTALAAETPDPAGYREVIDQLRDAGCLLDPHQPDEQVHWTRFGGDPADLGRVARTTLVLLGDPELVEAACSVPIVASFHTLTRTDLPGLETTLDRCAAEPFVLPLRDRADQAMLLGVDQICARHGVRWSQFHLAQGRGFAGPTVVPGHTPDYQDLLGRRLTAAERVDVHDALLAPLAAGRPYLPPAAELSWMLHLLLIDVERGLAGVAARTSWAEVELDPVGFTVVRHPLLPLPDRPVDADPVGGDMQLLCDSRTGLITNLPRYDHHESIPSRLMTVQSNVADMRRIYTWANNVVCGGSAFDDLVGAQQAAVGEAVERYCGNCVTETVQVREASYAQLRAEGEVAVDPEQLVLYSDRLYDSAGFPFVRFTPELSTHWVRGHSLTRERAVWVPASLVYVNWYMDQYADVPPTNYLYYPGIAAGPSLEWALASGIEEVVERDATMIWWHNRQPLPKLELPDELAALWAGAPRAHGQRPWLIYLENEFDIPVIAGVLEKHDEGLLNVGFAARNDPLEAARKAWTEALTLQDGSRDIQDPTGLTRSAIAEGWVSMPLKPWREDQAYLDSYAPDFSDVNDLMCQQEIFLDPRAAEVVRPWLDPPGVRPMSDVPQLPDRSLQTYRKLIEARGYEIIYVDLTTQDVAMAGFRVVRVIIPGLVPNFPAAFPFLGRRRIQDAAVQLGWRSGPLTEQELNYFPLPHA